MHELIKDVGIFHYVTANAPHSDATVESMLPFRTFEFRVSKLRYIYRGYVFYLNDYVEVVNPNNKKIRRERVCVTCAASGYAVLEVPKLTYEAVIAQQLRQKLDDNFERYTEYASKYGWLKNLHFQIK